MEVCICDDEERMDVTNDILHVCVVERIRMFCVTTFVGMSSNASNTSGCVDISTMNGAILVKSGCVESIYPRRIRENLLNGQCCPRCLGHLKLTS